MTPGNSRHRPEAALVLQPCSWPLVVQVLPPSCQVKEESGWSIPLRGSAEENYAQALEELNAYFLHPNKELYRLMEALGPASGWRGTFGTSTRAEEGQVLINEDGSRLEE